MKERLRGIPPVVLLLATATLARAQEPADASATMVEIEQAAKARKSYEDDVAAAEKALLGAVEAKIQILQNNKSMSLEQRAKETGRLEECMKQFRQAQTVPASEIPEAAKKFHVALAEARRKCRKAVLGIAKRAQRNDASIAVAMVQDLNGYCPRLVSLPAFVRLLKPIHEDLANRKNAHNSVKAIRSHIGDLLEGIANGSLTAQQLTDGCTSLLSMLESSPVYEDKTKLSHRDLHEAARHVRKLLEAED